MSDGWDAVMMLARANGYPYAIDAYWDSPELWVDKLCEGWYGECFADGDQGHMRSQ